MDVVGQVSRKRMEDLTVGTHSHTHTHPRTHTRTDCERTQGVELKRDEAWSNRVLPRLMADGALCQEDATAKVESNLGICMDAVGCMLVC